MPRKILNVGRVKGSMWYSGTNPQEVQKPLEGDLYLDKESSKIFIFKNNVWEETTDFDQLVKDTIKENSNAIDSLKIATSSNYDIDSDKQIPTTKTVKGIVDNFKADEFEPFKNEVETKLDKKANSTDYLPLTGGIIDGDITIKGATTYNDEVTLASTSLFLDSSSIEVDNGDISVSAGSIFTSDGVNIGPNDEVIIDTGGIYLTGQVGITINEEEVALKSDFNNHYTKDEVLELIGKISTLSLKVVSSLPTTNIATNTIYLKYISSTDEQNIYEEYIYVNNKWELIGSTKVNLEGLVTEEQLTSSINSATADFVTEDIVNQKIDSKLSSVPTEESIDAKINNAITSLLTNKY